jgi:hypothetical protein
MYLIWFFLAVCRVPVYLPYMCNMITEQTGSYCRTFDRYCWEGLVPQYSFMHRRHPPPSPVLGGGAREATGKILFLLVLHYFEIFLFKKTCYVRKAHTVHSP